jgi:hypothetical protein
VGFKPISQLTDCYFSSKHNFSSYLLSLLDVDFLTIILSSSSRDLLNPANMKLRIRERPDESVFVEGLVESYVTCERDIFSLMARGEVRFFRPRRHSVGFEGPDCLSIAILYLSSQ